MIYARFKSSAHPFALTVPDLARPVIVGTEVSFPRGIKMLQSQFAAEMRAEVLAAGKPAWTDEDEDEPLVMPPQHVMLSMIEQVTSIRSTIARFDAIRQREGGTAEYREFARRFAHLAFLDHIFTGTVELLDYIDEHFVPWTGENAIRIGATPPKRDPEDRVATLSQGLAGRVRARPSR